MKKLRRSFDLFCYRNREKGIPNLMLYIVVGSALVYIFTDFLGNPLLYQVLCFDRTLILRGQIWRLLTYPLTYRTSNVLLTFIALFCYYSLGRAVEHVWGTLRFNLFYLTGVVLMDIFCMIFGGRADVEYLNLSLLMSYATLFPNAHFLILFIIPVKAWVLALFNLALVLISFLQFRYFPYNFFSVISLANYFLFFGKDVLNVIPLSWRANARRLFRRKKTSQPKVIPFYAASYEAEHTAPKAPYTHRCTVCGRTDKTNPALEFRYCSRCKGYYCYCEEHIGNHAHIQ